MHIDKNNPEACWISWILRLAIALLFAVASASKFIGGLENTAGYITSMFKDTFLPAALVNIYAHVLPFAEALVPLWLLTGIKLREGWIFTALVLVSLAFGMSVAKQPTAADVYMLVAIACAGLYFSRFDCCQLSCKKS